MIGAGRSGEEQVERTAPVKRAPGACVPVPARRAGLVLAGALVSFALLSFPTLAEESASQATDKIEIPPQEIQDVLAALQSDEATGRASLFAYLQPDLGDPSAVADRAIGLVRRLRGDPLESLAIAIVIADVAGEAFYARSIVRAAVDPVFTLPTGSRGWDLGPPDGPLVPGFERLSENDDRVVGDDLASLRRPGADELTTDGVVGIRRVSLAVPDGAFRLILVTDDISRTTTIAEPLGTVIIVNGRRIVIVDPAPPRWIGLGGFMGNADTPLPEVGAVTGGALSLDIDIMGGMLDIALPYDEGAPTFLVAIILEPAGAPSAFRLTPETQAELDALLIAAREAESRLASAIADLLAGVATAAGVEQRIALLQLDQLPFVIEDVLSVSPE